MDKSSRKNETQEVVTVKKTDIYRETALRYLGYAGSLGWICRAFVPFQLASMVSVAYVCADIFDKANAAANRGERENEILMTAADAFTWHVLASFAIPGAILHGMTRIGSSMRTRRSKYRSRFFLLPCLLSGLTIPIISKPIDNAVENLMNLHFRKQEEKPPQDCKCNDHVKLNSDKKKSSLRFKWFYDQSRDQNILELERHRQKLKEQREREESMGIGRSGVGTRPDLQQIPKQRSEEKPTDSQQAQQRAEETSIGTQQTQQKLGESTQAGTQTNSQDAIVSENESQNADDSTGLVNRSVQVDKTTKPPGTGRPPRPPTPE